jgi:hypothetical protein
MSRKNSLLIENFDPGEAGAVRMVSSRRMLHLCPVRPQPRRADPIGRLFSLVATVLRQFGRFSWRPV